MSARRGGRGTSPVLRARLLRVFEELEGAELGALAAEDYATATVIARERLAVKGELDRLADGLAGAKAGFPSAGRGAPRRSG